jgi:lactate dehydrogenase-like 2-hydroxyacid dehydrogenase
MTKKHILTFETFDAWDQTPMDAEYTIYNLPHGASLDTLPAEAFETVEAFAFKGHDALGPKIMDAFPKLGMIANYGVGYDTIDVAYATTQGIKVSNTPDVLTDDVADLAVGMVIGGSRGMVGAHEWIKSGNWAKNGAYPVQRTVSGKSVGIVGLGRIGRAVAERMQPFGGDIHYYSRSAKETPGWTHHSDIAAMAGQVDILIVTLSGGPDTVGMVGAEALKALGSDGLWSMHHAARRSTRLRCWTRLRQRQSGSQHWMSTRTSPTLIRGSWLWTMCCYSRTSRLERLRRAKSWANFKGIT